MSKIVLTSFFFFFLNLFPINKIYSQSCSGSLAFNNISDEVLLPLTNQMYSSNGFTWECWFKLNTPFGGQARSLIMNEDPVVYEDIFLGFGWNLGTGNFPINHIGFKVDGPNSTTGPTNISCHYIPPGGFLLGTWYHAAGVMDYTTHIAKLYLNGVLVDTKTVNSDPLFRPIQGHLSYSPNLGLGGNLDEVRIWKKARTAAEIFSDYNHCLSGNELDLVSYYRCNQSTGITVIDGTINGNNGVFANSTTWSTQQPTLTGTACATSSSSITVSSSNSVICSGTTVTLSVNGATSYTWSTGAVNSSISVTPSVTTTYTVNADMSACSATTLTSAITVSVVSTPTISISVSSSTICSSQTSTLIATGANTYTWSSSGPLSIGSGSLVTTNPTITTVYTVTGTLNTCMNTAVTTVSVLPSPTLILSPNSNICQGLNSSVTLTVSGANTYNWVNASTLSSSTGSNVVASPSTTTIYTVTGLMALCSNTSVVTVSVNPSPTITAVSFTNTSCGLNNGSILIISSPANNTYTWSGGIASTTNTANSLAPGSYTVSAYNGACNTSTVLTVLNSIALQITSATITPSDCGMTNGVILVQDNYTNSTYSWSPNVSSTNSASNLSPSNYALTITNGPCSTSTVFIVPQLNGPSAINVNKNDAICESLNGNINIISILNGTAPYQYSFNNSSFSSVSTFSNLAQGTYTITVKDVNSCVYTNTFTINKSFVPSSVQLTTNFPTCNLNDGSFVINNTTGGTAPFLWSFNGSPFSTVLVFEELGAGEYLLMIRDSNLCETNLLLEMPFDKNDYTLYVPNTFTPNEDLKNDTWFVKGTCINIFSCIIFNRWGEKIIELKDINEYWDGTYKGKNVPDGVYVYLIEAETNNGTVYKNGHITLFR